MKGTLRPDRDVDFFNRLGSGHLPGYLGVRVTGVEQGLLRAELPLRPELFAPNGFLHAAAIVALADTAAGYACLAHLPDGAEGFTTLELKVNFSAAAQEGSIRCEARAFHLGRTTHVWDSVVYGDRGDRPVAAFRCTQLILYPESALEQA